MQTAAYDYHKADGTLAYQVVRYDDKSFKHRRPDPDNPGNWIWDMQGVERVPYHLPELLAADPATTVFVTATRRGQRLPETLFKPGRAHGSRLALFFE